MAPSSYAALFDDAQLRMGVSKLQVRIGPDVAEGGGEGLDMEQEAELAEIEEASSRHEAGVKAGAALRAWATKRAVPRARRTRRETMKRRDHLQ